MKTLGRVYNNGVTDRQAQHDLKKIKYLVQKINKSFLSGMTKVWVLLLAMIGWPLMIYKIPLSWVESVEAYFNGYLCEWLVVSKNTLHKICENTGFH